jgi:hypothetical protein
VSETLPFDPKPYQLRWWHNGEERIDRYHTLDEALDGACAIVDSWSGSPEKITKHGILVRGTLDLRREYDARDLAKHGGRDGYHRSGVGDAPECRFGETTAACFGECSCP